MGYNNNFRRGGYNRGGYNNGYNRGGYDRQYQQPRHMRYDVGQRVIHRASGIELTIVRLGREQYECRKPDLSTGWFYENELDPMDVSAGTGDGTYAPIQVRSFKYDVGQKVVHHATGTELIIVRIGREQYECRKPDLTTSWFYEDELDAM